MTKTKRTEFEGQVTLQYWCPGCDEAHSIRVQGVNTWQWNGDTEKPDVQPSIKVTHHDGVVCHCHLRHGQIEFLPDCYHALAGKTVALPDWPY